MLVESYMVGKLSIIGKENFTAPETWDAEAVILFIIYIIWVGMWFVTIGNAIKLTNSKGSKNTSAAIVLSVLSWPFYWLFKIYGSFGKFKR